MGGHVEGRLEAVVDGRAVGWVWDRKDPERTLAVEVLVDGERVAGGTADVDRPVLVEAGMGTGRYGFDVPLPERLAGQPEHSIRLVAGAERANVRPFEQFETVVRFPDTVWARTTFVADGSRPKPPPFIPPEEPEFDPGEGALVGEEGWLFLADDAYLRPAELAGDALISRGQAQAVAEAIAELHRNFRELGIPYLFSVVPLKERVYGDFLPNGVKLHRTRPVDEVDGVLRRHSGAEVHDLLRPLVEARRVGSAFPRTDSRWSDLGAFFGYRELLREAGKRAIALQDPLPYEDARFTVREHFRGDLAAKPKVRYLEDRLKRVEDDGDWEEKVRVAELSGLRSLRMPAPDHLDVTPGRAPHLYEVDDAPQLPRAVLVGDASCPALIPWLAEHFSRFVFLWTTEPPMEAIELEMPHVVMHVVSEAHLVRRP